MNITASVCISDDKRGLHQDYEEWLAAHLKRTIMRCELVAAVTKGRLYFGTREQIFYYEFDG